MENGKRTQADAGGIPQKTERGGGGCQPCPFTVHPHK